MSSARAKRPPVFQRPLLDAADGRDPARWWAQSGRKDWTTPDPELDLVRAAFGVPGRPAEVDLDPCSNPWSRTRAARECMLERGENGLNVPWRGKVFANPPYGVGEVDRFTSRARTEALSLARPRRGGVTRWKDVDPACDETILLVPANTETKWYHRDCATADALCFRRGRIQFRRPPNLDGDEPWKARARELAAALEIAALRALLDEVDGWDARGPDLDGEDDDEKKQDRSTVANLWVYWGPRPEHFVEVFRPSGHAFITDAGRARP